MGTRGGRRGEGGCDARVWARDKPARNPRVGVARPWARRYTRTMTRYATLKLAAIATAVYVVAQTIPASAADVLADIAGRI